MHKISMNKRAISLHALYIPPCG